MHSKNSSARAYGSIQDWAYKWLHSRVTLKKCLAPPFMMDTRPSGSPGWARGPLDLLLWPASLRIQESGASLTSRTNPRSLGGSWQPEGADIVLALLWSSMLVLIFLWWTSHQNRILKSIVFKILYAIVTILSAYSNYIEWWQFICYVIFENLAKKSRISKNNENDLPVSGSPLLGYPV